MPASAAQRGTAEVCWTLSTPRSLLTAPVLHMLQTRLCLCTGQDPVTLHSTSTYVGGGTTNRRHTDPVSWDKHTLGSHWEESPLQLRRSAAGSPLFRATQLAC